MFFYKDRFYKFFSQFIRVCEIDGAAESYFHSFYINAVLCTNRINLLPQHNPTPTFLHYSCICGQPLIWGPLSCRRRLLACSGQPAAIFYSNSILTAVFQENNGIHQNHQRQFHFKNGTFFSDFLRKACHVHGILTF